MSKLTAEAVLTRIRQLPSLPAVVLELLASLEDEDADVDSLVRKISQDQALVVKTLRVANSSFFGLQGQVETIQDALVVLGFRQLRTLVVAASVNGRIPGSEHSAALSKSFWQHGLLVGLSAQTLAKACGRNADGAFTAGLLHDVGRLALAGCFPDEYGEVEALRKARDCYPIEAERELLGIDHAEVGGAIAARWNLPVALTEAIALHHAPPEGASGVAALIHVADVIAHALDLTGVADDLVPSLQAAAWNQLGLDWPRYKVCLLQIEKPGRELLNFSMA